MLERSYLVNLLLAVMLCTNPLQNIFRSFFFFSFSYVYFSSNYSYCFFAVTLNCHAQREWFSVQLTRLRRTIPSIKKGSRVFMIYVYWRVDSRMSPLGLVIWRDRNDFARASKLPCSTHIPATGIFGKRNDIPP